MNEIIDNETGEIIPTTGGDSALEQLTRGEIDVQIATAHKFPRSVAGFKKMALAMVTQDEDVARESIYVLPARRGGDGRQIEGPSVRFAEMIQSAWGNCRSGARVIHEGPEFITAQGVFHDLQTNSAVTMEVQRRIVNKEGRRFNIDMISQTANAACAVALRNAVLRGIPKALWQSLYVQAKKTIAGDEKTFKNRLADAVAAFKEIGITRDQLYHKLGVEGGDDLSVDHLIAMGGMLTAIQDGELSVSDFVGETQAPAPTTAPPPTEPKPKKSPPAKKAKAEPKPKPKEPEPESDAKEDEVPELPDSLRRTEDPPTPEDEDAGSDSEAPPPDAEDQAPPAEEPETETDEAVEFEELRAHYEGLMADAEDIDALNEIIDMAAERVKTNVPVAAWAIIQKMYKDNHERLRLGK